MNIIVCIKYWRKLTNSVGSLRGFFKTIGDKMLDLLRNAFHTGVGAAELTKEKAEKFVRELAEKGKLSEGEVKTFVDEILVKSQKQKDKFDSSLEKLIEGVLNKMNLVSRKDLTEMEERLMKKIEETK